MVPLAHRQARKWWASCRGSPAPLILMPPVQQRQHTPEAFASVVLGKGAADVVPVRSGSHEPAGKAAPGHDHLGSSTVQQGVACLQQVKEQLLAEPIVGAADAFATLKTTHKLWCSSPQKPQQAAYLADILPVLSHALTEQPQQLKARELVWAAIYLGQLPGCSPLAVAALCDAAKGQLSGVPATSLAALLQVLAQLGVRGSDALLAELMKEVESHLSTLSGSQLVNLLVCSVRLGVRPATPWLYAWEDASRPELQGLGCDDLSSAMRALSEISFTPAAAWMAGYLGATQHRLSRASEQQLADIMQGLARLGAGSLLSTAWHKQALQVSTACMPYMTSNQLTRLLTAVAALGVQPDAAWVSAAAQRGLHTLPSSSPRDTLDLLLALTQLQPKQPCQPDQAVQQAGYITALQEGSSGQFCVGTAGSTSSAHSTAATAGSTAATADSTAATADSTAATADSTAATADNAAAAAAHSTAATAGLADSSVLGVNNLTTAQHSSSGSSNTDHELAEHWFTPTWQRQYMRHTLQLLPRFTAVALVHLLTGLAAVDARPNTQWWRAYIRQLHQKLEVLGAAELAALPESMLRLADQPTSCQHVLARWAVVSSSKLGSMSDSQLLGMAKALQQLSAGSLQLHGDWKQPGHVQGLQQLDTAILSNLLWAVTISGQQPPKQWVDSVMTVARARVLQGRAHSQVVPWQAPTQRSYSHNRVVASQHSMLSSQHRHAGGRKHNVMSSATSYTAEHVEQTIDAPL